MTGPKIASSPVRDRASEIPTVVRIVCGPPEDRSRYRVSPPVAVLPGQPVTLDLTALVGPQTFVEASNLIALILGQVAPASSVHVIGRRLVVACVLRVLHVALTVQVSCHGERSQRAPRQGRSRRG